MGLGPRNAADGDRLSACRQLCHGVAVRLDDVELDQGRGVAVRDHPRSSITMVDTAGPLAASSIRAPAGLPPPHTAAPAATKLGIPLSAAACTPLTRATTLR